ncbi:MAG: 23S rRNA (uracil(1939)-C(5))-methyltransferase RlmD [Cytophagales bacterium]|nr:23S rRNA (uracil(1939)-C(5))-methyltransferase RlmD [Cytophagales bacterium]
MKFGEIVENLEITGISSEGKSIGRHDGLVVFVKDGVPGDVADVQITHRRRRFVEGQIHKLHTSSPHRTKPFCEHFGTCGGCKWQHLSYEAQLQYKQEHVSENLAKISGLELPRINEIIHSQETTHYRNKLEFTFSNKRWLTKEEIGTDSVLDRNALGFHIPKRFDKILDINTCHLQADPSNEIRLAVKDYAVKNGITFFDIREQHGLLRNLIIRTSSTGELMVIVQFFETAYETIKKLMSFLKEEFPKITSLNYIINQKKNETFNDQKVICYNGTPFIQEQMDDLTFRIGPKSFYQTNSKQAHRLYQIAEEMAEFKGDEVVFDLYTGTGTIANFIARKVKKVVGVEYVPEAIEDAKVNSEINEINNTEFFAGDMKDVLNEEFVKAHGQPDVIIADPPRAGMHADVIEVLNKIKPSKLVYVSCNPATQARDIELLSGTFEVIQIQPVDMFPQTQHVENVILLELRK